MTRVDLNCDLGESFGRYTIGLDEQVIPLITSCNIACGFHAGDPSVMHRTVALASKAGIGIGAHPGYRDLEGFGRRPMSISDAEAYDAVVYQVSALMGVCATQGARLHHVKPHGALYNRAAVDASFADAIARAVRDLDDGLVLVGLASGELVKAGRRLGLRVAQEYFVDRNYDDEGRLADRRLPDALITDEEVAFERAIRAVEPGTVTSLSGKEIAINADTICVHGDGPQALEFTRMLRSRFVERGIALAPVRA
jgi:UPF0271 protein